MANIIQDIGKKNMNKEMHREHDLNDPNFYNLSKNKCCEILRFLDEPLVSVPKKFMRLISVLVWFF
jgi:hypothetical protein